MPRREPEPHIYDCGQARETILLRRTLAQRPAELLAALGLFDTPARAGLTSGGWWVALGIPNEVLFGHGAKGDVDLLAGRMHLRVERDELEARANKFAAGHHIRMNRSVFLDFAAREAAEQGRVDWPPSLAYLVAAEAKASWFHPITGAWKRTHKGDAGVAGQVNEHVTHGFDRVSFLHLGASMPVNDHVFASLGTSPDATQSFPVLFDESDAPHAGYVSSFVYTVSRRLEHEEAATEPFFAELPQLNAPYRRRRRFSPLNPLRLTADLSWRQTLGSLLADVEKPKRLIAYLGWCKKCCRLSSSLDVLVRECGSCGRLLAGERPISRRSK